MLLCDNLTLEYEHGARFIASLVDIYHHITISLEKKIECTTTRVKRFQGDLL